MEHYVNEKIGRKLFTFPLFSLNKTTSAVITLRKMTNYLRQALAWSIICVEFIGSTKSFVELLASAVS